MNINHLEAIRRQLIQEEKNYEGALLARETSARLKEIKDKIGYLKKLLNSLQQNYSSFFLALS